MGGNKITVNAAINMSNINEYTEKANKYVELLKEAKAMAEELNSAKFEIEIVSGEEKVKKEAISHISTEKELNTRRVTIIQSGLQEMREGINTMRPKNEEVLRAYENLEDAFSKVFDAEARFRASL